MLEQLIVSSLHIFVTSYADYWMSSNFSRKTENDTSASIVMYRHDEVVMKRTCQDYYRHHFVSVDSQSNNSIRERNFTVEIPHFWLIGLSVFLIVTKISRSWPPFLVLLFMYYVSCQKVPICKVLCEVILRPCMVTPIHLETDYPAARNFK